MRYSTIKEIGKKSDFIRHLYWDTVNLLNKVFLSDKAYYRKKYKKVHGEYPNLDFPKTFSEKLVWCMLNYRNELFIQCADKYAVREFVKMRAGEQYLISCYGIYNKLEEIDLDKLPDSFVLKATHGSSWNILCKDKRTLDRKKTLSDLKYWLNHNYYDFNREWPYKYIQPRVICEKYIGDEKGTPPMDYKIFCFDGEPKLIQLDIARFGNHQRNVYDIHWNQIKGVEIAHSQDESKDYRKPENLEEMLEISRKLSKGITHVRIDLYDVQTRIYFGEMTFFHGAGVFEYFRPKEFHLQVGFWFTLPPKNIETWNYK